MTLLQRLTLLTLRLSLGFLMFYAGITKVLNPMWSAEGYLANAKTFSGLYQWFSNPEILPVVNFLNEWGLTLIGVTLMLGVFVRLSAFLGALMMLLYYFPILDFPFPNAHAYLIDEHIIYFLAFLVLAFFNAGRVWGIEGLRGTHDA